MPSSPASEPRLALRVRGLSAGYGPLPVLTDIDLAVPALGVTAIVGRNGAGKTTLLRAIVGLAACTGGSVEVLGADVTRLPAHLVARRGVGYVPQERSVFAALTVRDNLRVAQSRGAPAPIDVLGLFPRLRERLPQLAGSLSGGERKMLAIAMAVLADPGLLLLDEPTEGVWHALVSEIRDALESLAQTRAVVLVEQHLSFALALAGDVIVLERGRIVRSGPAHELREDPSLLERIAL
jgi:branched-chain amino acid transport system ATP-binding protein